MANRTIDWRLASLAATLLVAILTWLPDQAVAQRNGNRSGREQRPNRDTGDNNRPAEALPAKPTPAAAPSATSFGTESDTAKYRKWASDMIASHDKSGDKMLAGDELKSLGQSAREADVNGDGKITSNELFEYSMSKAAGATSSGAAATKSVAQPAAETKLSPESLAQRKIVNTTRKSYRFKTTKERLKTWRLASKDANGDGQVSMSEYTRSWSDRTAAEFGRYDKDNDGLITAAEAK